MHRTLLRGAWTKKNLGRHPTTPPPSPKTHIKTHSCQLGCTSVPIPKPKSCLSHRQSCLHTKARVRDDAHEKCSNSHRADAVDPDKQTIPVVLFKNKYALRRHIAHTIYGNLYTCCALDTGEIFACKVLSNARARRRLTRCGRQAHDDPATEAHLLQVLRNRPHPHLCGLADRDHNYFGEHTHTYFVFPLAEGDLHSHVKARARGLPPTVVGKILAQLVGALTHLHTLGWQHGDVSLENILVCAVDARGLVARVQLCDFGLARKFGCVGRRVGKSQYRPPETYTVEASKSFSVSGAQDVFSLGVSMYTCLFGSAPFEAASNTDTRYTDLQTSFIHIRARLQLLNPDKSASPLLPMLAAMMCERSTQRPTMAAIRVWLRFTFRWDKR